MAGSGGGVGLAAVAAVAVGFGTALVYPTLIAAISDAVSPVARASVVGVYRFWRDMGYVAGGLLVGVTADAIDYGGAIVIVAVLTALSGVWVAMDMPANARPRQERDATVMLGLPAEPQASSAGRVAPDRRSTDTE